MDTKPPTCLGERAEKMRERKKVFGCVEREVRRSWGGTYLRVVTAGRRKAAAEAIEVDAAKAAIFVVLGVGCESEGVCVRSCIG